MMETNFSSFYIEMLDKKMTPHQIASYIAYQSKDIEYLNDLIDDFVNALEEFWKSVLES